MKEQVALVTGSSRGIGRAIALQLALDGFRVVINCRSKIEEANKVLDQIKATGGYALVIPADVSDPDLAQNLVDQTVQQLGRLDVLVNNAGINQDQLILRISNQDWTQVLNTNLNSAFYCSRAVLKSMVKNRYGRIINISSVVGLSGNAGQTHYAAAKAGIIGLTRSIAREYGKRGITANAVAPGYIQSDMTASLTQPQRAKILEGISLGRLGTPEDVAGVISFLASPSANYISGQVIRVDGGMASL